MKTRFATLTLLSAAVLLASLAVAGPAAAQVAKIRNTGDALVFVPIVETERITLTITGPCQFEYRTASKGERLVFRLSDEAFDGAYTFDIGVTPLIDGEIMEILADARRTGKNGRVRQLCRDGKLPTGPTSQSGGFTIFERRIVLDTTPESERSPRDEGKQAAEPRPGQDTFAGDQLAVDFRAEDADIVDEATLLASADTPSKAPGECLWDRIKISPDLQGR